MQNLRLRPRPPGSEDAFEQNPWGSQVKVREALVWSLWFCGAAVWKRRRRPSQEDVDGRDVQQRYRPVPPREGLQLDPRASGRS